MNIEKYVHQIWLIAICLLLLFGLFMPIGQFSNQEGATALLTNFRMNYMEGVHGTGMWALAVIQIFALAIAVFELLLSGFRNFVLQKRLIVLLSLLLIGYYIIYLIYVLLAKGDASFIPLWAASFPLISLIFCYMTFHGVQKAEADIIARASGFRLRD